MRRVSPRDRTAAPLNCRKKKKMSEQEIQAPNEGARVRYVRVTNLGEVMFMDRHDGVPLRIQPGESRNVPIEAAAHIFGWKLDVDREVMFKHIQRRQGWNTPKYLEVIPETGKTLAEAAFAKLKIEPVMYKLVEVERDPDKPIPADPEVPTEESPRAPKRVDVRA